MLLETGLHGGILFAHAPVRSFPEAIEVMQAFLVLSNTAFSYNLVSV
jgi:hypothetical protein